MATRQWWERPRLRTDEEEERERRVSWLELFYDLVFVVVVAEVAHYLAEHISAQGVLGYVLLFIAVWWAWIGGTFYTERFETQDVSYRLLTFLQMLPVAAMAVFASDGLGASSAQFALAYAAVRSLITFMWLRGGWHELQFRPVAIRYSIGFTFSILLFVLSVFVPPPLRFVLWGVGLLSDLVTPATTLNLQRRLPRFSSSRLPERFGLFVIIVLGEAIVGVVQGVAEQHALSLATGITGTVGMALVFGLWWVYFDFIARRPFKRGPWWQLVWVYLHLPLVMSIAAIGAGVLNVLTLEPGAPGSDVAWLLGGAAAVALVAIGLLELTLRRAADEPTDQRVSVSLKLGAGVAAMVLGLVGGGLGPAGLLTALVLLVLVQMIYGAYVWYRSAAATGQAERSNDLSDVPL